jgi:2-iminobutanoate/2-iminopropanoate deaminase
LFTKNLLFLCISALLFAQCHTTEGIRVVTIPNLPKPSAPYNLGIWADDTYYLAGQIALDAQTGDLIKGSLADEAHQVMHNLEAILAAAGLTFENVIKPTVYLTDTKDFATLNEVYRSYFKSGYYPVRETVQVAGLVRGARIEISMVAHRRK